MGGENEKGAEYADSGQVPFHLAKTLRLEGSDASRIREIMSGQPALAPP